MTKLLAGDIGGTKTILRLNHFQAGKTQTLAEATYSSAEYPHLNAIVQTFLAAAEDTSPQRACFAIAGPVTNNTAQLTNLPWQLDAEQMQQGLEIPYVHLLNDFAAVGYGILALTPQDLHILQAAPVIPQQPVAVLGAGTGLGEAILAWQGQQYEVLPLEGGHTDFAARTDLEIGLLKYLQQRHGRVSVERVVSGQGIVAIYQYLRSTGLPESTQVKQEMQSQDVAAVVARHALAHTDRLCEQALDMFVAAYGAEAGNLALKSLPYGGIYLAGGVGPKILPKLQDGIFIQNFLDKGRMRSLLANMQVALILNPKVGLIGAALYAERLQQSASS